MAIDVERVQATDQTPGPGRRAYLTVLALLALSFMVFQIAVLRELRFQLSTIFTLTPFLFSSVIAFIGLGSLCAGRITWSSRRVLCWGVASLPVVVLLAFALTLLVAQAAVDHATMDQVTNGVSSDASRAAVGDAYIRSIIRGVVAVSLLGYGPVFVLQGLIFALYFREGRRHRILSNVYAADLLASGGGALVGGALSFVMTPAQMVLAASALLLVTLWVSYRALELPRRVVAATSLGALALITLEVATGALGLLEAPWWFGEPATYSRWSRYRRIDAVEGPRDLMVFADGLLFHLYDKQDATHALDPRARLIGEAGGSVVDVLVIGAGTGADVRMLRNVASQPLNIVAVELDGGFVRAAQAFPWLWRQYRTAEIIVQEGRYFLENDPRTFDTVIYAYIDPQAAISDIGLPDANFLYTDSGLRRAYAKVRPGGYLIVTRVFFVHEQEEFVRRLCATLEAAGVPPDEVRLYRTRRSGYLGYYGETASFHVIVRKGGRPPEVQDQRWTPVAWSDGGRPTTDFFPISMVTGVWFDTLVQYIKRSSAALLLCSVTLLALLLRVSTSVGYLSFFLLGFGSFLLESLVLFNSFLLLGDPNLSAAVAVGVFLVWSGVGSLLSERWERSRWLPAVVPAAVLFYAGTAPLLNGQTIAMPLGVRILVFAVHLSVAGVVAGGMFPIALRRFAHERVTSMFFIDVVGCALAPVAFWLAMSAAGIWPVAAGAVASYGVAATIVAARR